MKATALRADPTRPLPLHGRMKWRHGYFFLAGLVVFSLYLNHRMVVTHRHTVQGNLQWVARLSQCDALAKDAGGVNTPASDVLRSRDADAESLRMQAALSHFIETLDALRSELSQHVPPNDAGPLINDCADVGKQMSELVERANVLFSSVRENETDALDSQIVLMSHDYDDVLRALDLFRMHLRGLREAYLEAQTAETQGLARLEWLLGGLILVILAGITVHAIQSEWQQSASEAALFASEHKYRELVEQSSDAIITADNQWNIRFVNTTACQMLGYTEEELLRLNQLDTYLPEERELGAQRRQELRVGQTLRYERNLRRKDGTWFPTEVIVRRVDDGMFQGILRDITDRKRAEADLENLHKQLQESSRQTGMAEMATSVLHNVGNVLNSLNVSFAVVSDKVRKSKLPNLAKAAELLQAHKDNLAAFLTKNPKGAKLPGYLISLAQHLTEEQAEVLRELKSLLGNVQHIKEIVAMQQSYSKVAGVVESLPVVELVEDALRMNAAALSRHEVQVIREYSEAPPVAVDKHKVIQILVNLIRNAKHALDDGGRPDKRLTLRVARNGSDLVHVSIVDNGVGIRPENLTRIFERGFTTRKDGHGFGLHSGATAAQEMGGTLTAQSAGVGEGATFTLTLPCQRKAGGS